jgi:hypothetical protein
MLDLARFTTFDAEIRMDILSPQALGFLHAFGSRSRALRGADGDAASGAITGGEDLVWGTLSLTQLRGRQVRRLGSHKIHESWVVGVYRS